MSNKVVFGDEVAGDSKVSITINKRIWQDKAPENIQNTGEVLDFGGQPLNGSEFTVYDVSDKYYELIKGSNQKTAIEQIQSDSNQCANLRYKN
ncbi:pilin N-terminal domain-containing protein [Lactococcus cremoris]